MGFFSELKADLSQAVNEMLPEEPMGTVLGDDDLPDPSSILEQMPEPKKEKIIFHKIPAGMENAKMPLPIPGKGRAFAEEAVQEMNLQAEEKRMPEEEMISEGLSFLAQGLRLTGDIESTKGIYIGEGAVVIGNITAPEAKIAGAVKGDIDVKGPVILAKTAVVVGNIRSKSVQIETGAVVEGMCSQCYAEVNASSLFDRKEESGSDQNPKTEENA